MQWRVRHMDWSTFPFVFLGYGFLYAWGYVVWETPVLSTQSFTVTTGLDLTWLASAITVPLALAVLALVGRRGEIDGCRLLYVVAPLLAAVGTILSVIYRSIPLSMISSVVAVSSGLATGLASALFIVLWGLQFSRLDIGVLEVVMPSSFIISILCSLVVPLLSTVPGLVVALMLTVGCGITLTRARDQLDAGRIDPTVLDHGHQGIDISEETRPWDIARILLFGCLAWTLSCLAMHYLAGAGDYRLGIDVTAFTGYTLALLLASLIIRFATRVDFRAYAYMTLAPFVIMLALAAVGLPSSDSAASVLDDAMGVCFEIILMLYFIRLAQGKQGRRTFYLAIGSSAGYAGVLIGTMLSYSACAWLPDGQVVRMGFYLTLICVYVVALLLVPERRPYALAADGEDDAMARPVPGFTARQSVPAHDAPAEVEMTGEAAVSDAVASTDPIDAACMRLAHDYQLSSREAEMCVYLAHGRSQTYIRDALFLSKNTVATHTRHLYAKLDVHSKQELIDLVEAQRS